MADESPSSSPKPRDADWSLRNVSIIVALIGAVATAGTAASSAFVTKFGKDREIEVEKAKLEFEKQRDARKVENEYFQKATDPSLSPEQRQRVFRFLQIALQGKPLQKWATSELDLAKEDIKVAQAAQRQLADLQKRLSEATEKSTSQEAKLRSLEAELVLSKKIAASQGRLGCETYCAKAAARCPFADASSGRPSVCDMSFAQCRLECLALAPQ
jgi:hypothetical protein